MDHMQPPLLTCPTLFLFLQGLTVKLLRLRELLPNVNVSMLVSRTPTLALDWDMDELEARLHTMR